MVEDLFDMCVHWWNDQIKPSGMYINLLSVVGTFRICFSSVWIQFVSCCCYDVTMSLWNVFLFSNCKLGILWLASPWFFLPLIAATLHTLGSTFYISYVSKLKRYLSVCASLFQLTKHLGHCSFRWQNLLQNSTLRTYRNFFISLFIDGHVNWEHILVVMLTLQWTWECGRFFQPTDSILLFTWAAEDSLAHMVAPSLPFC